MESVVHIDTDLEDQASTDCGLEDTSAQFILNLLTGLTSPQYDISRGIQNLHMALISLSLYLANTRWGGVDIELNSYKTTCLFYRNKSTVDL